MVDSHKWLVAVVLNYADLGHSVYVPINLLKIVPLLSSDD